MTPKSFGGEEQAPPLPRLCDDCPLFVGATLESPADDQWSCLQRLIVAATKREIRESLPRKMRSRAVFHNRSFSRTVVDACPYNFCNIHSIHAVVFTVIVHFREDDILPYNFGAVHSVHAMVFAQIVRNGSSG